MLRVIIGLGILFTTLSGCATDQPKLSAAEARI